MPVGIDTRPTDPPETKDQARAARGFYRPGLAGLTARSIIRLSDWSREAEGAARTSLAVHDLGMAALRQPGVLAGELMKVMKERRMD